MAIFRNVHITFWTDPKIVDDFTPEDKYFYIYLLTNPHTNLCGCYEVSLKQMSDELGYCKETVEKLIIRFHEVHRLLHYNKETKEMLLYNWSKYNWTKSPKFQTALLKEIPKVKCPEFNDYLNRILNSDTVSIPYQYGIDTTDTVSDSVTGTVPDTGADGSSGDDKKAKPTKAEIDCFFDSVWELYPVKKGKGQVSESKRKELYKIGFDEIERAIDRYLGELKKDSDWRKPQNGSTFFNSGHVDYLDKNFVPQEVVAKPIKHSNYTDAIKNRVSDVDTW